MADKKGQQKELAFQLWYNDIAQRFSLPPDPNDPRHVYDYKAAFEAGRTQVGEKGDLPAEFRTPNHPQRFIRTESGKWFDTSNDKVMPENTTAMLEWFGNRVKTNMKQEQQNMGQPQGPGPGPQGMGQGPPGAQRGGMPIRPPQQGQVRQPVPNRTGAMGNRAQPPAGLQRPGAPGHGGGNQDAMREVLRRALANRARQGR